jgi:hypothetical protein
LLNIPGDALIEHRAVITAGLVAERTGKPTFADPSGPFDDQVLCPVDPAAGDRCLEQRAVEAAGGTVIDVFDRRLVAQPGVAQPCPQPPIIALGGFAIEQEGEPFGMRQRGACWVASSSVKARAMPASPSWCSWSMVGWVSTEHLPQW